MPTNADSPAPVALRDVRVNLVRPKEPVTARVHRSELCSASRKAAGFCRHIEIDVSGTPLEGACAAGQSIGVLAPGSDDAGKPHKVRLYSLASPSNGEDGDGKVVSTTVKRVVDEHWDTHALFLGVASNYLCDLQEGDELRVTGPAGKRFVLPDNPADYRYTFVATGTGIAPFRGMLADLLDAGCNNDITLIMGAPYATDLLYHEDFLRAAAEHPNFRYITAISREKQDDGHDRMYVQARFRTERDALLPQLSSDNNLIYICGLAGMELGVFQELARSLKGDTLERYLSVSGEALADVDQWDRKTLSQHVKPTDRVKLEVYA